MTTSGRPGLLRRLYDHIVWRVIAYYAVLGGATWLFWHFLPGPWRQTLIDAFASFGDPAAGTGLGALTSPPTSAEFVHDSLVLPVTVSIVSALAYALPVAWVYMFTRQKRGYSQSVVHSLILLPVAVAGVVVLVKESLPLAFGLAGIVAAVRFRNTLEDSRDAVYIFVSTALGLSAAVRIEVAAMLSVLFNAVVLSLWYSDFGRLPPALEGVRAQRDLEKAMAVANRTSQFVARLDREVLAGMAPQQLEALEGRLARRKAGNGGEGAPRLDVRTLHVMVDDFSTARDAVDPLLEALCKRWRYRGAESREDGDNVLTYEIRLRKGLSTSSVVSTLMTEGAPAVRRAEFTEA
ncbi:MAG TPA: DUF4956 domain-containing protein [Gemmatimonadaceae bacterium]|nr:DUF4956 domain-containing protein [Gemmatimonadaceae bacterium]